MDKYRLDENGEPVLEPILFKWAEWFENNRQSCVVKKEWVDNVRVSTVFLGLDHAWAGPPVLWETRTFSNRKRLDGPTTRCSGARKDALEMHQRMVEVMKAQLTV